MKKILCLISVILFAVSCETEYKEQPVEIPFHYKKHMYLKSLINDTIPVTVMFDTGAYGLYLDSTFNNNSGLAFSHGLKTASDTTYCSQLSATAISRLPFKFSVQSRPYHPDQVSLIQAKPTFGKQCDAIVGWDIFRDHVVRIDYKKSLLTVMPAVDFEPDPSYTRIPLTFKNNLFFIDMEVAVSDLLKIKGSYLLDLGYNGCIYFTGETAKNYNLEALNTDKVSFGVEWGMFETRKSFAYSFRGSSLSLDNLQLKEPIIDCSTDKEGVLSHGDYLGLLGNHALEHFDVMIDLSNAVLYLKPNSDYETRMRFKTTGFGFSDRTDITDGFIVTAVFSGAADSNQAALQSGDIVTHINGRSVKENPEQMLEKLSTVTGRPLSLRVSRKGKTLSYDLLVREELK